MTPPEQTGAFVLGFSRENVLPGETVRVVIVPLFPFDVPEWSAVDVGAELLMYEGTRVCGLGRVLWREDTSAPQSAADEARLLDRLSRE